MPSTKFVTSEDGSSRPRCSTRAASPMEDIPHQISHVFRYAEKKKNQKSKNLFSYEQHISHSACVEPE